MSFKLILALAYVGYVGAGYASIPQLYHAAAPVEVAENTLIDSEYDPHPQYRFSYGVDDQLTGDSKSQVEERDGDVVRGEYSLIDADGYRRTVQYTADAINGFNAVVRREPLVKAVAVEPIAVKTISPVVQPYALPVTHYSAPSIARAYLPVPRYAPSRVVKSVSTPVGHYAAPSAVVRSGPAVHYTTFSSPYVSYRH